VLKFVFLTLVSILVLLVLGVIADKGWNGFKVAQEKKKLEVVINSLEDFRLKSKKYPKNLNELIPGFLTEIPPLSRKVDYYGPGYRNPGENFKANNRYQLIFFDQDLFIFTGPRIWFVYNSDEKRWHRSELPD
jgi:hypothetical protein